MNFYSKSLPYAMLPNTDQRKSPRKLFRQRVSIGTTEQSIIQGYTVDISTQGLSVLLPVALAIDEPCVVRFNLLIEGQSIRIAGVGKIVNCTCTGLNGFRVGMTLKAQDATAQLLLSRYAAA